MKLFCTALSSGKYIPTKYASKKVPGGQNISLPFSWMDIPDGCKSFALSMIDRHPAAMDFPHWVVFNMSFNARAIEEGASQNHRKLPAGSVEMRNGFRTMGYSGPSLEKGAAPHEFLITVYALNVPELQISSISPFAQFLAELSGKVLASASLVAIFAG